MSELPPLPQMDEAALVSLRGLLERTGYHESNLLELSGLESFVTGSRSAQEVHARLAEAGAAGLLAMGGGTSTMRYLVPRGPTMRALDLGTGAGTLALLMAGANRETLGVDLNARAVALAELNARPNAIDNVDFAAADMFDLDGVAAADGYDAIYAQPPFLIRPDAGLTYRDAVWEGDDMIRATVREAGRRLLPGGLGVCFCNWIVAKDGPATSRLAGWVDGLSCDLLILQVRSETPEAYVDRWLKGPSGRGSIDPVERRRWLDEYDALGIEAFATGAMCLRRRTEGRPWVESVEAPDKLGPGAADELRAMFDAIELLGVARPDALRELRLVPAPSLRLRQELTQVSQGWAVGSCASSLGAGLMYELNHDAAVGDLSQGCDGRTTLEELVVSIAKIHGASLEEVRGDLLRGDRAHDADLRFLEGGRRWLSSIVKS